MVRKIFSPLNSFPHYIHVCTMEDRLELVRASKNDPVDHFIEPVRRGVRTKARAREETGIAEQNSRTGRGGPNTLPQWIILGRSQLVARK